MPRHLEKRRRLWYAVLDVPKDIRRRIGRRRFVQSLGTDSLKAAERRVGILVSKWKGEIEAARKGTVDPIEQDIRFLREIFKATSTKEDAHGESERDNFLSVLEDHAEALEADENGAGITFYKKVIGELTGTTEHVDDWIASIQDTPKTKDMKRREVTRFAEEFPVIEEVTRAAVKRWCVKQMNEGGLTLRTLNKNLSFLRSYWSYLTSVEVVPEDHRPLHDLGLNGKGGKGAKQTETVPFSPENVIRLRKAAETDGDQQLVDLITLGMWTGARIEELCSLKAEMVGKDSFKIEDAKTPSGWREVPIHSKLKPTMAHLTKNSTDGYVLSGLTNNKYEDRSNAIGKRFGRLKTRLGFRPRIETFHSIRGTVATLLENAQVPESIAADIIGHDKPTMTYGLYSGGASLEVKRKALEKISYPEKRGR